MKQYKIISATALAAMLVTSSSTFVYAVEKETTPQQVQAAHVFSSNFIEQTQSLDAIPMNNLDKAV
ncbi:hypothetical protein [Bacillus cereus]|uniref:hypothetical protein n=1 Tax=Bacillus cereus TaxID=1396 RepID=UPI001FCC02FC|nr:hypothetical protein [Bacillus cereus]